MYVGVKTAVKLHCEEHVSSSCPRSLVVQSIGKVFQEPEFESLWGCMFFTLIVLTYLSNIQVNVH